MSVYRRFPNDFRYTGAAIWKAIPEPSMSRRISKDVPTHLRFDNDIIYMKASPKKGTYSQDFTKINTFVGKSMVGTNWPVF